MPRPLRDDRPGALYHVVNRSEGSSPLFETQEDIGRFLGLLSATVKDATLRILCFSVLSTHFHLVVESLTGELDAAMGWIQDLYARYFNRTRKRPGGHAFKGRYFARLVDDLIYLAIVIVYIDRNAVKAGMVSSPELYPHGSARYYAGEVGPRWLSRDCIEDLACRVAGVARYSPALYPPLWTMFANSGVESLVAKAAASPSARIAPISVLMRAGPAHVQAWLMENLAREHGRRSPHLVVPGEAVLQRFEGPISTSVRPLVAGLLATLAGWTCSEVGRALDVSQATASRLIREHADALTGGGAYAEEAGHVVSGLLRKVYGSIAALA